MNSVTTTEGGFDKIIFESVLDTYAGGVTIDPTGNGYTNSDGLIPAGSIVGKPNATTGLANILPPSTTGSDFNDAIGLVYSTVKLDESPMVSVVIDGTARQAALGWSDAQAAAIAPKLKKIIIV